jgi:pyridinium-3,5-bisthiocarboxylic acid mononucleotide nickel chelatase
MTHLHLLCDEGICAERWLGALVHAGAHPKVLREPVERAGIPVSLEVEHGVAREVAATWVRCHLDVGAPRLDRMADLHAVIGRSGLVPRAAERAHAVASALGHAEAAVHDLSVEAVQLHELGRPVTAARIVAGAAALEDLEVEGVTVGPVAVGAGHVDIAHGRFPVPPPAVIELLRGFVIEGGPRPKELTSPSGAAVLAALAEPREVIPRMQLLGSGRGAVHRDGDERLLTVLLGTSLRGR